MTLKELAHLAHQTLQDRAGCPVKRSHVHELIAAAFGHRSWASFLSESGRRQLSWPLDDNYLGRSGAG